MQNEIELILTPGATFEQCRPIARAFVGWCMLTRQAPLSHRLRLIIQGGPYQTTEETAAIWRKLIPPDAVEDVLINGTSLTEIGNTITPASGG